MADPAVNHCSRVDTPSIASSKIALIARLLTDWSSPSCPLAGLIVKNSLIKEYHNICRKPPHIITIELPQL
jgi:hypothetical protein